MWPSAVSRLAAEWRLPIDWIAAACLVAGIPCDTANGDPPAAVLRLANDQRDWLRVYLPDALEPAAHPVDVPALRLRALYRAIYCDAPEMRHILMLLAARHLRLSATTPIRPADEMLAVYVPAAQRLGMYRATRLGRGMPRGNIQPSTPRKQTRWVFNSRPRLKIWKRWSSPSKPSGWYPARPWADSAAGGRRPADAGSRGWLVAHLRHESRPRAARRVRQPIAPTSILFRPARPLRSTAPQRPAPLSSRSLSCASSAAPLTTAIEPWLLSTAFAVAGRRHPKPGHPRLYRRPQPNGYRTLQTLGLLVAPCDLPARLIKVYILTEEMYPG